MNTHYTYLLIDIATIFFPLLLSFDKKVAYYKLWKHLFPSMLFTGGFFIVWDIIFTKNGVWRFNDLYVLGLDIADLPLEEWLFFVVVPYSCVFIYECLLNYFPIRTWKDRGWTIFLIFGCTLTVAGLFFLERQYTATTFGFCGLALLAMFVFKNRFRTFRADAFLICFGISLVPFFIVNGILTAVPVVIYNDAENLGIRLFTIPFEDTFYGMLLMLGNVAGLEWRRGRSVNRA